MARKRESSFRARLFAGLQTISGLVSLLRGNLNVGEYLIRSLVSIEHLYSQTLCRFLVFPCPKERVLELIRCSSHWIIAPGMSQPFGKQF